MTLQSGSCCLLAPLEILPEGEKAMSVNPGLDQEPKFALAFSPEICNICMRPICWHLCLVQPEEVGREIFIGEIISLS